MNMGLQYCRDNPNVVDGTDKEDRGRLAGFVSKRVTIFLGTLIAGCLPVTEAKHVNIRLENASDIELENIVVTNRHYGSLGPGEYSRYLRADGAYRYARLVASHRGSPLSNISIDYVGEVPLAPGFYTYRLSADPVLGQVEINLLVDQRLSRTVPK